MINTQDDVAAEVAKRARQQIEDHDAHRRARGVRKVPGHKPPTEQELMQHYYELYSKASRAGSSAGIGGWGFLLVVTLVTVACGIGAVIGFFRAGALGMIAGMLAPIVVAFAASRFARFRRRR